MFRAILFTTLLSAALTANAARADLSLRFVGTAQADDLSAGVQNRVDKLAQKFAIDLTQYNCFQGVVQHPDSGAALGVGVDCLRVFNDGGDGAGDGLELEAYTFFILKLGSLVSNGFTSVRPFFAGTGDGGGDYTHMTGSIPTGPGGLVGGTGSFKSWQGGSARLSGAVDLSNAGTGEIGFNCLFHVGP